MMIVWIHLINWPLMLVSTALALLSQQRRTSKLWQMMTRLTYVVALVSGGYLLAYAWQNQPYLAGLKTLLALAMIGGLEVAFAKKNQGKLKSWLPYLLLAALLLLGIFGWLIMH